MRKALTGVCNNAAKNIDVIKVWANSFEKHTNGDAVLIAADMSEDDKLALERNNIKYFEVKTDQGLTINDSRLIHTANWIEQSDYDVFMVTDVFDVCFQGDPFEIMDFEKYDYFVGSEGIRHFEEPWNMDVMRKAFPRYGDWSRYYEVICSGVMGGKKESLVEILRKQQELVDQAENGHDIRDQAALNILIHSAQIENIKIFHLKEGWVVHCALAGPTFQHKNWGIGKLLETRQGLPKLVDGKLLTKENKVFKIAHQYNRIPKWNKEIIKEYV